MLSTNLGEHNEQIWAGNKLYMSFGDVLRNLKENAWELGWIQTVQYSEPFYHQYDMALLSRIPNLWINSPSSRWENVID